MLGPVRQLRITSKRIPAARNALSYASHFPFGIETVLWHTAINANVGFAFMSDKLRFRLPVMLPVLTLILILAGSSFTAVVVGNGGMIYVKKVTTNGDTTTIFHIDGSGPGGFSCSADLHGGGASVGFGFTILGDYTLKEAVPAGWVVSNIGALAGLPSTTFTFIPGEGIVIHFAAIDTVTITFTNCPASQCPDPRRSVGGIVLPANSLAILTPYLAIIGLVATAAIAVKRKHEN